MSPFLQKEVNAFVLEQPESAQFSNGCAMYLDTLQHVCTTESPYGVVVSFEYRDLGHLRRVILAYLAFWDKPRDELRGLL